MRNIAGNRVFNMILLFTIIGEFIVPWILERFYSEYNGKIMVMSVLGKYVCVKGTRTINLHIGKNAAVFL